MNDFPLKYFRDVLKVSKKYLDSACLLSNGTIVGIKEDDCLGAYYVVPTKKEKLAEFAPLTFRTEDVLHLLNKIKAKDVSFKTDGDNAYISDSQIEVEFGIPKDESEYRYPAFVEHVFNNAYSYNFLSIGDENIDKLSLYQPIKVNAFYKDGDIDPEQLIVSGKDFSLTKTLVDIEVAAVDKDTEYQEKCNHGHVIVRLSYDECDVFMLCGVV